MHGLLEAIKCYCCLSFRESAQAMLKTCDQLGRGEMTRANILKCVKVDSTSNSSSCLQVNKKSPGGLFH